MNSFDSSHEFAFYCNYVKFIAQHKSHLDIQEILDPFLTHRISNVLRLQKGENIILFDSNYNIKCTIRSIDSKKNLFTIEVHQIEHNIAIKPHITWLLPLLKKETFEESLYVLTAMGAQAIQPIITEKTKKVSFDNQGQRYEKILISAAEQSKQFILPNILPILSLNLWLTDTKNNAKKLFFDKQGTALQNVINDVRLEHCNQIYAFVGPEGDLTQQEKIFLAQQGFVFCALTKSILRTEHAITVAIGALRSLL